MITARINCAAQDRSTIDVRTLYKSGLNGPLTGRIVILSYLLRIFICVILYELTIYVWFNSCEMYFMKAFSLII